MAQKKLPRVTRGSAAPGFRRAVKMSRKDFRERSTGLRSFSLGHRPVMRWVKGGGLDDEVTKTAIGEATRLFGDEVDYCLCTNDISADRVRNILSAASQPVEWWQQEPSDNPALAAHLEAAGCPPDRFGYWWKWFPWKVRFNAPEWILDGDMVVVAKPPWFESWRQGRDGCRISQDDSLRYEKIYGRFQDFVSLEQRLYSGLVSLPPQSPYGITLTSVLDEIPLDAPHDGVKDMCEQGAVALTFERLRATSFPLSEFPFGRASETTMDFGCEEAPRGLWGYHFGQSFVMRNRHFERLREEGVLHAFDESTAVERARWLGNRGQWGEPGWSIDPHSADQIYEAAKGRTSALELGTSRGFLTSVLLDAGVTVTTVDHLDRGAAKNLEGRSVHVVVEDAASFLVQDYSFYDLVVVDLHDNSRGRWRALLPLLEARVADGGLLILNNTRLAERAKWKTEHGVAWALEELRPRWETVSSIPTYPGVEFLRRG